MIVIAALPGRSKDIVKEFLAAIPLRLKNTIKHVCTDMYDGFVNAVIEALGSQTLVIDRYHVAKLYRAPLDKLRMKEMARLKSSLTAEEYKKLDSTMWILRKQHECLTDDDKNKLTYISEMLRDQADIIEAMATKIKQAVPD